jgi:hypothetical protein
MDNELRAISSARCLERCFACLWISLVELAQQLAPDGLKVRYIEFPRSGVINSHYRHLHHARGDALTRDTVMAKRVGHRPIRRIELLLHRWSGGGLRCLGVRVPAARCAVGVLGRRCRCCWKLGWALWAAIRRLAVTNRAATAALNTAVSP